jgi:hypothetical protein
VRIWLLLPRKTLEQAELSWDRQPRVLCMNWLPVQGERQWQVGPRDLLAAFEVPREALRLPEPRRAARQEIPGPPSGRTLRGASAEVMQLHNYINSIGTKLHEAIGNRDVDLIRS